ncbi:nitroreductase [Streptomyces sp. NPDC005336]|uniref:nitroreductase family protein n=1 Tax=unclassified Streptomyces TaxID=2593676 RepID=UPI0033BD3320
MNVAQAVLTRHSATRLTGPGPTDEDLVQLVELAMTAPDHGRISPWRLVSVRGHARRLLGESMVEAMDAGVARERTIAKALRAPLLVSIVFCPEDHPKVPEWEQLAATACAVQTLILLIHERDWGCIWRTGAVVDSAEVRKTLGVVDGEQLLGWLYVGTPDRRGTTVAPRPLPDPRRKLTTLGISATENLDDELVHRVTARLNQTS